MANNTTLLSRRSFSTLLAASGFLVASSRRTTGQEPSESVLVGSLDEPNRVRDSVANESTSQERWTAAQNESWQWYERESLRHGQWMLTGITTPVHRATGKRVEDVNGYLDESLVPIEVRRSGNADNESLPTVVRNEPPLGPDSYGQVSLDRRSQDGRPPSEWLRSMEVEELREWLAEIEVSEAGVQGMTFWTHLTRDHMFRPLLIKGLTEVEQAKLHAAAHFGY